MIKVKKAFSLIEVIFVLVILGIVASISSQIIVQVYENYITQKALYTTTIKTEMAINQMVNRLTYAIAGTTISKNHTSPPYTVASENLNWKRLSNIERTDGNRFTTIEWIGADNDSFSAGAAPYWTGVANYDGATTARNSFETPGSQLNMVNAIITNLSNTKVTLTGGNLPAVIFSSLNYFGDENTVVAAIPHSPACMGLIDDANTSCISRVSLQDNTHFNFPNNKAKQIVERYKFAWSAYALVPEDEDPVGDGLFNLYLYSNYQPWNNEDYRTNGTRNLLIANVSVFKFTENAGVIQLKLCTSVDIGDRNATGDTIHLSSCKEKAIIR